MKTWTFIILLVSFTTLGCSQSDKNPSNTTINPSVANKAPTVNVGSDKRVEVNTTLNLTATASDSDGTIKLYQWKKGSSTLASSLAFAYTPTTVGIEILTLVVTDNEGAISQDSLTITITEKPNVITEVLASADVTKTAVTEMELIQATLDEIEASKKLLWDAKMQLFNLNADGSAKADNQSLTTLSWDPTHEAVFFTSILGKRNTPILYTNTVTDSSYSVNKKAIGIIGEESLGRYIVLGSNPFRTTSNTMDQFMENSLSWLTRSDDLKKQPFKVVLAHLDESQDFPDETKTRAWLDSHYAGQVTYNTENSCDNTALQSCLTSTDLLIVSQHSMRNNDYGRIAETIKRALKQGVAVLYIHHKAKLKPLGKVLLNTVFNVNYEGNNKYKKLAVAAYDPRIYLNELTEDLSHIKTLFTHFKQADYQFDWTQCHDGKGEYGSKYDNCDDVTDLSSHFQQGANIVRRIVDSLDEAKINIFLGNDYRLQKLLILTADKFRQSIHYPMDKVTTNDNDFMRSFYADHAVYNYRKINPLQPDMGNFSRSDFSHITTTSKTINLNSKKQFRSVGVYALPGETVKVTRHDNAKVIVKVFINTLRSSATQQFKKNGYKRPKYLKTQYFEIYSGETIALTSPYGGPLQLLFDTNDLPVSLTFDNIGEHPYWASSEDNASFAQKMVAHEYDWAEIATAGFEVHSKFTKMIESIDDPAWGSAANLAEAIEKYTSNYPHVLAGFQGDGIDVVPEIHNWAAQRGITIETIDTMKHMNADQASCGYGCSGNPYDAFWAFNPIGHGDIHEMGHSLQKMRFEGFPNHAATNTFSYYTKSRYFDFTGKDNSCGKQPFKSLFETIQGSFSKPDRLAYLKTNLWDTAGLGEQYLLKIQAMMHAQKQGKVTNGWHVLARVHILEREMRRAKKDWDNRKLSVGFDSYSLDEINTIRSNDWLVIAYSYAAELDYRSYFDMMGIPFSDKARQQIASFNYDSVPNSLFVSTENGYCNSDEYGYLFNRATLPIDGNTAYAY